MHYWSILQESHNLRTPQQVKKKTHHPTISLWEYKLTKALAIKTSMDYIIRNLFSLSHLENTLWHIHRIWFSIQNIPFQSARGEFYPLALVKQLNLHSFPTGVRWCSVLIISDLLQQNVKQNSNCSPGMKICCLRRKNLWLLVAEDVEVLRIGN